jgi:two-component system nitrate/nitrite response regulator NarL
LTGEHGVPPPGEGGDPVRIVLVDDHAVMRQGLRMLLEGHPGLEVTGEAADRAGAVVVVGERRPAVVLLDIDLGSDNGLDAISDLRAAAPSARVLILTGLRDIEIHRRAIQRGASGVVEKDAAPEVLVKAIRRVAAGEVWIDRRMTASILSELTAPAAPAPADPNATRIASLSARENELISLIGEGLSNKGIASRMRLSEITVRHHLTSIYRKLEVRDRLELLLFAYRNKLVTPP